MAQQLGRHGNFAFRFIFLLVEYHRRRHHVVELADDFVAVHGFGVGLRRFLDRPAVLRAFNVGMALLLVLSLLPVALELWGAR